jgi:hypothetical protein
MNIIIDSGNSSYFETRALEFISEAQVTHKMLTSLIAKSQSPEMITTSINTYREELSNAIKMLIIAILKIENGEI